MKRATILFFIAVVGLIAGRIFTYLLYLRYGYPNNIWVELNPLLHSCLLSGEVWLFWIHTVFSVLSLYLLYRLTLSKIIYARVFGRVLLYGLAFGFTLDAINDAMVYYLAAGIPYEVASVAVVVGGICGGVEGLYEVRRQVMQRVVEYGEGCRQSY
ncbi:MAG: hypothetical protein QXH51_07935 [Candidatus Bathyarchaeia archaeon]